MFQKRIRVLGIVLTLTLIGVDLGCSDPSEVEAFKRDQAHSTTPHGRIDPSSVEQLSDGSIGYRTQDGRSWKTDSETAADGTIIWREPQPRTGDDE